MKLKGIDVSKWQGAIDWDKVKSQVDFVILRAGYGKNIVDSRFLENADECKRLNITFGVYWFSYALSPEMAEDEARYICNIVKEYSPAFIAYDYEDDSEHFAERNGRTPTNADRLNMAESFLKVVAKDYGFIPCLYVNLWQYNSYAHKIDYKSKGYYLWLAEWNKNQPSVPCDIWQYSDKGSIDGIEGSVDLNYSYVDFRKGLIVNPTPDILLDSIKDELWNNYLRTAKDVISGKYGNGMRRIALLHEAGYNPELIQKIVNILMK